MSTKPSDTSESRLKALWALSDFPNGFDIEEITRLISRAPDPETASREVTARVSALPEVLQRKWHKAVTDIWSDQHPSVPLLPDLPLAATDVAEVPALRDAHVFLRELAKQPAPLIQEAGEWLMDAGFASRLAKQMPSLQATPLFAVENEWGFLPLRRLRATLQAARLVRPYQGRLHVVRTRYERFLTLPMVQQFYVLWHADVYHVSWPQFADQWHQYVHVIQDYLPLLWDLNEGAAEGQEEDSHSWCAGVMDVFVPLWEQEGLLAMPTGRHKLLTLFQQCALPNVLEKVLLRDVLARFGLVINTRSIGSLMAECTRYTISADGEFAWTNVGSKLLEAERTRDLPCGLSLLD